MIIPPNEKRFSYDFSLLTARIRKHTDKLIAWEHFGIATIQNDKVIEEVSAKITESEAQNLTP
jgi:hypothetical protein